MKNIFETAISCGEFLELLQNQKELSLLLYVSSGSAYERVECVRTITWYPGTTFSRTVLRLYGEDAIKTEPEFLWPSDRCPIMSGKAMTRYLSNEMKMTVSPEWPVLATTSDGKTFAVTKVQTLYLRPDNTWDFQAICLS